MAKDIRIIPSQGQINVTGSADFKGNSASSVLFVSASGEVGVNTTSPAVTLDVAGQFRASSVTGNRIGDGADTTKPLSILNSNMSNDSLQTLSLGRSNSNNNQAEISFYLASAGSSDNRLSLGLYNSNQTLNITGHGNVGIGTVSPVSKLNIVDSANSYIRLQRTSGTNQYIDIGTNSGGEHFVYGYGDYPVLIGSNGNTRMTITSAGNVGVGTTGPTAKLEIYQSGSTAFDVQGSQGQLFSVTDNLVGSLMSVNDISGIPILEVFDTDKVVMGQFGANTLVVTGSRVGIGTASPAAKLDVRAGSGFIRLGSYDDNYHIKIEGGDQLNFRNGASAATAYIQYAGPGHTLLSRNLFVEGNSSGGTTGAVRITSAGNVGIGTTSPSHDLHVFAEQNGDGILIESTTVGTNRAPALKLYPKSSLTTERYWAISPYKNNPQSLSFASGDGKGYDPYTSGSTRMIIDGISGAVGIGVINPSYQLHVDGDIGVEAGDGFIARYDSNENYHGSFRWANLQLGNNGRNRIIAGREATGGYLEFWVNNTNDASVYSTTPDGTLAMKVAADGNVGIGTSAPDGKLQVYADTDSGLISRVTNNNTGTDAYSELIVETGTSGREIRIGSSHNYNSAEWNNAWIFAANRDLALKSSDNVKVYAQGTAESDLITTTNQYGLGIKDVPASNERLVVDTPNGVWGLLMSSGSVNYGGLHINDGVLSLQSDGATSINLATANVGIGTTNPSYKLDVVDAARIDGVRIGRDFSIANRATVRLDANGDNPADILFGQTAAANETSWTGAYWGISSRNSGGGAAEGNKFTIWRGSTHASPNNSENQFITITPDLKFGIGDTTPSYKLTVAGEIYGTALRIDSGGGNSIRIGDDFGDGGTATIHNNANDLYLQFNANMASSFLRLGGGGTAVSVLDQENNNYRIGTNATASYFGYNSGNVGIGTNSPDYKLEVNASSIKPTADLLLGEAAFSTSTDYMGMKTTFQTGTNDYMMISGKSDGNTYVSAKDSAGVFVRGGGNNGNNQIYIPDDTYINIDTATLFVNGDLTVDGIVTAQEFHTEFVSASIIYQSGSTQFGNSIDDEHVFTGALNIVDGNATAWGLPQPGRDNLGGIHLGYATTTDNAGSAITFGARDNGSNTRANAGIYVRTDGSYGTKMYFATTDSYTVGSKMRMTIEHTGNVGIGVTAPAVKLQVSGNASVGTIGTPKSDWWSAFNGIQIGDGTTLWGRASDTHLSSNYYAKDNSGTAQDAYINTSYANDFWLDNADGTLIYRNAASGTAGTAITWNTRLKILNNGNVGIGTTDPSALLDVYAVGTNSGIVANFRRGINALNEYTFIKVGNSAPAYFGNMLLADDVAYISRAADPTGGNGLFVQGSGNVGIGTTAPSALLDVTGTGNYATDKPSMISEAAVSIKPVTGSSGNLNFASVNGGEGIGLQYTNYAGTANWDMALQPFGGRVGIGNVDPSEALDVNGNIKADRFAASNEGSGGVFEIAYSDQHKREWTTSLSFSFTAAGTYYFNLIFTNSGGYHYDLTATTSRNGLYRNFGTLRDSSYIYWESDGDFVQRAQGDLHLVSNHGGGMYFSADPTSFLSDSKTGTSQNGTANWNYYIVRYPIYIPYDVGAATGAWKLHLTTYGDTGGNAPEFVLA